MFAGLGKPARVAPHATVGQFSLTRNRSNSATGREPFSKRATPIMRRREVASSLYWLPKGQHPDKHSVRPHLGLGPTTFREAGLFGYEGQPRQSGR
jgi:hypothetical protein